MSDEHLFALVREADPWAGSAIAARDEGSELFRRLISTSPQSRAETRPHWRRRPLVFALVAAVAVVAASTSVGAVALVRLLNGQPAPPVVTAELNGGSATGEVQLTTSSGGTATLYAARMNGRDCVYLRLVPSTSSEFGGSDHRGSGICAASDSEGSPIRFATDAATRAGSSWLEFAYGRLGSGVASASLQLPNGDVAQLPLSDGYFLYELTSAEQGTGSLTLVAHDSNGNAVDQTQLAPISTGP